MLIVQCEGQTPHAQLLRKLIATCDEYDMPEAEKDAMLMDLLIVRLRGQGVEQLGVHVALQCRWDRVPLTVTTMVAGGTG